jgi:antitoxin component YwqK of YwqJK toxin-antitoxin module
MKIVMIIEKLQLRQILNKLTKQFLLLFLLFTKIDFIAQNAPNLIYLDENLSNIVIYENEVIFKKTFKYKEGSYILYKDTSKIQIISTGYFDNKNNKNGTEITFDDNRIARSSNYKNDTLNGLTLVYNKKGGVIEINNYLRSVLISSEKYDKFNKIVYKLVKIDTLFVERNYDYQKNIIRIDTLNKSKSILSSSIFCNNNVILYYKNYNTLRKFVYLQKYCNNTIYIKATCLKNNLAFVDKYFEYYENGNLKVKGQFKDTDLLQEANKKIGLWYVYNEDGKIKSIEKYSNDGALIKVIK